MTYTVLTACPSGESSILHTVGRQLLVQVGPTLITWNDILGNAHEAPIITNSEIMDTSKAED